MTWLSNNWYLLLPLALASILLCAYFGALASHRVIELAAKHRQSLLSWRRGRRRRKD